MRKFKPDSISNPIGAFMETVDEKRASNGRGPLSDERKAILWRVAGFVADGIYQRPHVHPGAVEELADAIGLARTEHYLHMIREALMRSVNWCRENT